MRDVVVEEEEVVVVVDSLARHEAGFTTPGSANLGTFGT